MVRALVRSARRRTGLGGERRRWAPWALILLATVIAGHPGTAAGDQATQPSSPAAASIVAAKYHSCALRTGAVRCWGYGGDGQLGYGNTDNIGDDETPGSVGPVDLGAGRTVTAIAAGDVHTCALLDDGTVHCWGYGGDGRLGYGNTNSIGASQSAAAAGPVALGAGRTAKAITAGGAHTCALLDDKTVRCWGYGFDGRLGYGNTNSIGDDELPDSVGPVKLGEGRTAKAITAGGFHTCALLDDDTVRCWGFGGNGRLGYGTSDNVARTPETTPDTVGPVDLGPGRTAKAISAGFGHTCAVLDNGSVRCWGAGGGGRLGYGNTDNIGDDEKPGSVGPVDLGSGRTAKAISAGDSHTCAILDDGSLRCWGFAAFGQLGYGNGDAIGDDEKPGSVGPVDLGAGRTAMAVSAGTLHTCARLDDTSVRCWGYGAYGRLGYCNGTTIGDDEAPGTAGPVDLGAGGASCPVAAPTPTPTPAPAPAPSPTAAPTAAPLPTPSPPPLEPDPLVAALAAQKTRAAAFRSCVRKAGMRRRNACLRRYGRKPGRISRLAVRATGSRRIRLSFRVAGTEGSKAPAARKYLIKQSLRPIRTARAFARAHALCKGRCSFKVTKLDSTVKLTVTHLRRHRSYHYAVAARDNVSGRTGPRSGTIKARVR